MLYGTDAKDRNSAQEYANIFQQVTHAENNAHALEILQEQSPDLVILDIDIADAQAIDTCRVIRAYSSVPLIVVGEAVADELVISLLDAGADDYVEKPFQAGLLGARARAAVRRYYATNSDLVVNLGSLTVDLDARRIKVHGEDVHFTPTEFALIAELTRQIDKVVAHERLIRQVWGSNYKGSKQYLYVYFGRIRQKLGDVYSDYIETIPGAGYMLRSEPVQMPTM